MDTMSAYAMGQISKDRPLMVFDWDKAAQLIKDRKPSKAEAGLSGDWEYTGGEIYKGGKPVASDEAYVYLASTWAKPELELDGDIMDCYIMEDDVPTEWGGTSDVYWPASALAILNS